MPNTYPTFERGVLQTSTEGWIDDLQVDRAINGTAKARALFSSKKRSFTVKHVLSRTERDTLETFYDANRLLAFYFEWGGTDVIYTCLFPSPPKWSFANGRVYAEVAMVEQ